VDNGQSLPLSADRFETFGKFFAKAESAELLSEKIITI
jgi:hypothetical protein